MERITFLNQMVPFKRSIGGASSMQTICPT